MRFITKPGIALLLLGLGAFALGRLTVRAFGNLLLGGTLLGGDFL